MTYDPAWSLKAIAAAYAAIGSATEVAITAADTATANRLHKVSGTSADYTITLPSVATAGTVLGFRVRDWAAANKQYTLDAGAGAKIAGRTRYLVLLHTNVVLLISDGTDWQPLVLNLDTPWVDGGAITITAVTTNPTKGTTTVDAMRWRRLGPSVDVRFDYLQTAGGTAGSGDYLFALPFTADTTALSVPSSANDERSIGHGTYFSGSTTRVATCDIYDTTHMTVYLANKDDNGWVDSGYPGTGLQVATVKFGLSSTYPITNW